MLDLIHITHVIYYISKIKDKNCMIISTHIEKALNKIQSPFIILTISKVGSELSEVKRWDP